MEITRKKCKYCGRLFTPDPRSRLQQYSCSRKGCQRKRRNANVKRWRNGDPWRRERKKQYDKKWRERHLNSYKEYRAKNPAYRKREKERMRLKRAQEKSIAKTNSNHRRKKRNVTPPIFNGFPVAKTIHIANFTTPMA